MNYIKMSPIVGLSGFGGGASAPTFTYTEAAGGYQGDRGILWGGYYSGANQNRIEYISISTTGNSQDFGDMQVSTRVRGSGSNGSKAIAGGGGSPNKNEIDKVTISTTGNSTDFGDLTASGQCQAVGDGTYCVWGGRAANNTLDYVTIATDGDASDFGDHTSVHNDGPGTTHDATRGCFLGGHGDGNSQTTIDYITVATPGNAADFGDMHDSGYSMSIGLAANSTRGLVAGGNSRDGIEYITLQSLGNGTDFGDMTTERNGSGATSDKDTGRACFCAGYSSTDIIDYVTIANTGNATDFGDMIDDSWGYSGCSGD